MFVLSVLSLSLISCTTGGKGDSSGADTGVDLVCLESALVDYNENGEAECQLIYDEHRNVVVKAYDNNGDGVWGDSSYRFAYTYDDYGNVLTVLRDIAGDEEPDEAYLYTYTYEADGRPLTAAVVYDLFVDGVADGTQDYTFDPYGNALTLSEDLDYDGNGIPDLIYTYAYAYTYDDDGNPLTATVDVDEDSDDDVDWTETYIYTYDAHGNVLTDGLDSGANHGRGKGTYTYTYTYREC